MAEHYQACFDVQAKRCVCPIGDREAAVRAAAPEMEALLREMDDYLFDREGDSIASGCLYEVECADAGPNDVNREDRPCWRCRRRAVLKRLDKVGR